MKLSITDLQNIKPVGKEIELKFETGYNGEEKSFKVKIYPLTVKEKVELQAKSDELNNLLKVTERTPEQDKRLTELNDEVNLDYAYFTTSKVIDGITREFIKDNFPRIWYSEIFKATLEAEGLKIDDIEKEKN